MAFNLARPVGGAGAGRLVYQQISDPPGDGADLAGPAGTLPTESPNRRSVRKGTVSPTQAGVTWGGSCSALERWIAVVGSVKANNFPSLTSSGNRSIGRGAGPLMIWP